MSEGRYAETFCPQLWRQRRSFILDILKRFHIETVLDYGCGEAAVSSSLIPADPDSKIAQISAIDIDRDVLQEAIESYTPWQSDFEELRDDPLHIDIYQGSIGEIDDRFKGFEAIICTEVIEHVYSDVLNSFLNITLGVYKPKILVVTTPNAEYNINFPDLKYGTSESKFRHDDHKFEWTRRDFHDWCDAGAEKYGYDVEYHGIGLLQGKLDDLENGHCTSACIFISKTAELSSPTDNLHGQPHKLLKHIEFPYFNEPSPPKEKILEELLKYIEILCVSETHSLHQHIPKHVYGRDTCDEINLDDIVQDWNHFNLQDFIPDQNHSYTFTSNEEEEASPNATITPLNLPLSSLWNIVRIKRICVGDMSNLKKYIALLPPKEFVLLSDQDALVVKKSFILDSPEDDSYSAKTFSSQESW